MIINRHWTVYALADPRTGRVRYIGRSYNIANRLACHLRDARFDKSVKSQWITELELAGIEPDLIELETGCGSPIDAEQKWLCYYKTGGTLTNVNFGHSGTSAIRRVVFDCALKSLRKSAGLRLVDVAMHVGISAGHLWEVERGTEIGLSLALKLAEFYGKPVNEIWKPVAGAADPSPRRKADRRGR